MTTPERLLVEAGAGCGKTYGLVARYLRGLGIEMGTGRIIQGARPLDPGQILAVTFTEDAAAEMEERILEELARRPENAALRERVMSGARIGTFHGLCLRLLKPHLKSLGYDAEAGLVSSPAARYLRRRHILRELARVESGRRLIEVLSPRMIADLGVDAWFRAPEALDPASLSEFAAARARVDAFRSRARAAARSAWSEYGATAKPEQAARSWLNYYVKLLDSDDPSLAEAMNFQTGPKGLELAADAKAYRDFVLAGWAESLREESLNEELGHQNAVFDFIRSAVTTGPRVLDFDALESETLGLLRAGRKLLSPPQLILVDEFQDTNPAQYEILQSLAGPETDLYLVGDPKQSIYSFRGADVGVFMTLKRSGHLTLAPLETNFRSEPAALDFMNRVQAGLFGAGRTEDPEPQSLKVAESNQNSASLAAPVTVQELSREASLAQELGRNFRQCSALLGPDSSHAALFRSWKKLYAAATELREAGVPVRVSGAEKVLEHPLTEIFASTLEWLDNPSASEGLVSLHRWLVNDTWNGVAPSSELAREYRKALDFDGWTEVLDAFALLVRPGRWARGGLWLTALRPLLEELSRAGWELQFSRADLGRFLRQRAGNFDTDVPYDFDKFTATPTEGPVLELLTIHGSKGLQWDMVYLPELYERSRGTREASVDDDEETAVRLRLRDASGRPRRSLIFERIRRRRELVIEAESRRLFYVAVTRAVKGLWIGLHPPGDSREALDPLNILLGWTTKEPTFWNRFLVQLRAEGSLNALTQDGRLIWHELVEEATTTSDEATAPTNKRVDWQFPHPISQPQASAAAYFREGVSRHLRRELSSEESARLPVRRSPMPAADVASAEERRRAAATAGEEIHSWLEIWNGSEAGLASLAPPPILETLLRAVRALPELAEFWQSVEGEDGAVQREFGLFISSPDFRLSGFADAVWFRPSETVILDWKTSRSLKTLSDWRRRENIRRQLALYAAAFRPRGLPVRGLAIGIEVPSDANLTPKVRVILNEVLGA